MNIRSFVLFLSTLFITNGVGCSDDSNKGANPPGVSVASAGKEKNKSTPAASANRSKKRSIPGVPALDLDMVGTKKQSNAHKKNSKGLKAHRKKNWEEAIARYSEGLKHNPGHILMRYNLGCAYALKGDKKNALAVLEQFKAEKDCYLCLARMHRATEDTDYQTLWKDSDFKALTKGAPSGKPDYKKLAKKFLKNMGKGYWSLLRKTSEAKHPFIINANLWPDGLIIRNRKELIRAKKKLRGSSETCKDHFHPGPGEDFSYNYKLKCSGTCCSVKIKGEDMDSSYGGYGSSGAISKVCFWPTSASEALIQAVSITTNSDCHE